VFGSFGWSGEAVDEMEQKLKDAGFRWVCGGGRGLVVVGSAAALLLVGQCSCRPTDVLELAF
jgi:hypothetical protein